MKKEIITTFSNGGHLIKMHPLQLQFLQKVTHRELKDAIKLGVISTDISLPDSMKKLSRIIYMKRYNSGKEAKFLNEILYGIKKYRKSTLQTMVVSPK